MLRGEMAAERSSTLRIRTAVDGDARWATDIYNAANPDDPHDLAYTQWIWGLKDEEWVDKRYAVELDGKPHGWLMLDHVVWPKNPQRYAGIDAWLHPRLHSRGRVDQILEVVERDARSLGAALLTINIREAAPDLLDSVLARGYAEAARQRYWELDLDHHRERILAAARGAIARAQLGGVRLLTLAEDLVPEQEVELHACYEETREDMPSTVPWTGLSPELFKQWLDDPQKRRDRFWIARVDGALVGMSLLAYPSVEGGLVSTAWTGVARRFRGTGLARTLKLATLAQAIQLGVPRVRTDNDSRNAPILHLNEELGYVEVPGHVKLRLALNREG